MNMRQLPQKVLFETTWARWYEQSKQEEISNRWQTLGPAPFIYDGNKR